MTGLIPFNKRSSELDHLGTHTFYNMIDDLFTDSWFPGRTPTAGSFKLDVKEKESSYIIEAELPGIKKEAIDLDLTKERLTISINREENTAEEKDRYVHRERRLSSMKRSIYLGDGVYDNITAKLDHGILTIVVPKKAPAAATKINID